jgi:hypothetical protein
MKALFTVILTVVYAGVAEVIELKQFALILFADLQSFTFLFALLNAF